MNNSEKNYDTRKVLGNVVKLTGVAGVILSAGLSQDTHAGVEQNQTIPSRMEPYSNVEVIIVDQVEGVNNFIAKATNDSELTKGLSGKVAQYAQAKKLAAQNQYELISELGGCKTATSTESLTCLVNKVRKSINPLLEKDLRISIDSPYADLQNVSRKHNTKEIRDLARAYTRTVNIALEAYNNKNITDEIRNKLIQNQIRILTASSDVYHFTQKSIEGIGWNESNIISISEYEDLKNAVKKSQYSLIPHTFTDSADVVKVSDFKSELITSEDIISGKYVANPKTDIPIEVEEDGKKVSKILRLKLKPGDELVKIDTEIQGVESGNYVWSVKENFRKNYCIGNECGLTEIATPQVLVMVDKAKGTATFRGDMFTLVGAKIDNKVSQLFYAREAAKWAEKEIAEIYGADFFSKNLRPSVILNQMYPGMVSDWIDYCEYKDTNRDGIKSGKCSPYFSVEGIVNNTKESGIVGLGKSVWRTSTGNEINNIGNIKLELEKLPDSDSKNVLLTQANEILTKFKTNWNYVPNIATVSQNRDVAQLKIDLSSSIDNINANLDVENINVDEIWAQFRASMVKDGVDYYNRFMMTPGMPGRSLQKISMMKMFVDKSNERVYAQLENLTALHDQEMQVLADKVSSMDEEVQKRKGYKYKTKHVVGAAAITLLAADYLNVDLLNRKDDADVVQGDGTPNDPYTTIQESANDIGDDLELDHTVQDLGLDDRADAITPEE
ncbi:hypothetical protein ACFL1H_05120 [Nanoarchaeota archaeon]